jgi:hypothetical protein
MLIWIIVLSIIVGAQAVIIALLLLKMREVKEIFNDHKANIEFLAHRTGTIQKILNMKEDDF